jgi:hypothetical protein
VLQTILQTGPEPVFEPTFNRTVLRPVSEELSRKGFLLETLTEHEATYRDKDRYITFEMQRGVIHIRLGIGLVQQDDGRINSMLLEDMIRFTYGGLNRGANKVEYLGVRECLARTMKDLREFASEFLSGDFRPFLRVVALKYRDEHGTLRESIILGENNR